MTEGCFKIPYQQKPRLTLTHDTANTWFHCSPLDTCHPLYSKEKVNLQNMMVTKMF